MDRRALIHSLGKAAARAPADSAPPSRAWLYVPSNVPRMLDKSLVVPADRLIFDLEDSVADAQKDEARTMLSEFLKKGKGTTLGHQRVCVRVNALQTPFFERDLRAVLALRTVNTIVLPKVGGSHEISAVERMIGSRDRPLNIVASIESALAVVDLPNIATWKSQIPGSGMAMSALLFAAEDYCADTRVQRTPTAEELVYPRSSIAIVARAFGLQSIDMVCVDYKDNETLLRECESARRLGFDGKQAIHPEQVAIIQEQFMPTKQEIRRAAKIVRGMKTAEANARGSFALTINGRTEMIDAPMLKQARTILRLARAVSLESEADSDTATKTNEQKD